MWNREEYLEWVMQQKTGEYTVEKKDEDTVIFQNGNIEGKVHIYPQEIVELSIRDEKGETQFYLHFHLDDASHAKQLTSEMLSSVKKLKNRHELRILLSCTSALTTSFFAEQLNEAARVLKLDYIFEAVSFDHIYEKGSDFDVVLLAPQIAFEYPKVRDIFKYKLVLKIPAQIFGSYDTGAMIRLIRTEFKKKMDEAFPEENLPIRSIYENPYRILTIAVIGHKDEKRFGYRIYDHGKKTLDKEVIKPDANVNDLFDLLDYVLTRHKNIDFIGISVPGVTNKGSVFEPRYGYYGENLSTEIYHRYHVRSAVINNVDAMALGYHAMHEGSDNMVFFFLPRGAKSGGAGVILDGRLHRGFQHNAGEVSHLTNAVFPDEDEVNYNPDKAMKYVALILLAYITTIAPEKIVYYSELTPNEEEVRKELGRYVQDQYIPELIHVWRLKRYQLPGTMIRCLEVMKFDQNNTGWWQDN